MGHYRYWLAVDIPGDLQWREVTKEQFVRAERLAGFRNTMNQPDEPATGGFSGGGVCGRVRWQKGESDVQPDG